MIYLKRSGKTPVGWLPLYIIVFYQFASLRRRTGRHLLRNNILLGRRYHNRLVSNVGFNRRSLSVIVIMPVRVTRRKEVEKIY